MTQQKNEDKEDGKKKKVVIVKFRADQMENRQAAKDVEKEQVAIKGMLIITLFILRNQITLYHL